MTRAMKENTPFRIAFCVLCHKYTPVLAELVHQLDAPGNGLFIHVDGKADIGGLRRTRQDRARLFRSNRVRKSTGADSAW